MMLRKNDRIFTSKMFTGEWVGLKEIDLRPGSLGVLQRTEMKLYN